MIQCIYCQTFIPLYLDAQGAQKHHGHLYSALATPPTSVQQAVLYFQLFLPQVKIHP